MDSGLLILFMRISDEFSEQPIAGDLKGVEGVFVKFTKFPPETYQILTSLPSSLVSTVKVKFP